MGHRAASNATFFVDLYADMMCGAASNVHIFCGVKLCNSYTNIVHIKQ